MASTDVALNQGTDSRETRELVVNNFSIQVATVNGSGSQSANSVLLRTIFLMGVPVSGKNLFPLQHCGTADMVHDSREQRRLRGAQAGFGDSGRDECGDRQPKMCAS